MAEMDTRDNPINLRCDLDKYIKQLKKENIEIEKKINELRDNGELSNMIDQILKKQDNDDLIKDLRRKFNEIRDEN